MTFLLLLGVLIVKGDDRNDFFTLTKEHAVSLVADVSESEGFALLPEEETSRRFKSCAVVGSGAILRGVGHGKAIDAADRVFRFNFPPTEGYEEDVGGRTDVIVIGHRSRIDSAKGPWSVRNYKEGLEVYFRIQPVDEFKDRLRGALDELSKILDRPRYAGARKELVVNYFPPLFELTANHVLRMFIAQKFGSTKGAQNVFGEDYKPTSGFRGFLLALLTCDRVDVYGFGAHAQLGNGHYFDQVDVPILENPGHNYSIEHDIMFSFAKPEKVQSLCRAYFGAHVLPALTCGHVFVHTENAVPFVPTEALFAEDGAPASQRQQLIEKKLRKQHKVLADELRTEGEDDDDESLSGLPDLLKAHDDYFYD